MLKRASELMGCAIAASDGRLGQLSDILFDDQTWRVRWVVVDAGGWLTDRKVLLPVPALGHLDAAKHEFSVRLAKTQIEHSPDIDTDRSVSRRMEAEVYDHFGWTPYWGTGFYQEGGGYIGGAMDAPYFEARGHAGEGAAAGTEADVHLRSIHAVTGYHLHAADGDIGHIEGFLVDDADWSVRYLLVETANWWPGKNVLISPRSVRKIDWAERLVHVNADRQKIKDSPAYETPEKTDRAFARRFDAYYADVP
jgi:hypothetical protein